MQWFANVKMSTKLFIGFGIMLVLIGTVIAISYRGITRIEENERGLFEQDYTTAMDTREVRLNQLMIRIDGLQMVLTKDQKKVEQLRQEGDGLVKDNEKLLARLIEREKNNPGLIDTLKEYEREFHAFADIRAKQVSRQSSKGASRRPSKLSRPSRWSGRRLFIISATNSIRPLQRKRRARWLRLRRS